MNIRLTPFTEDLTALILGWAMNDENAAFFRRIPPLQDWCTAASAAKIFSSFYVIWDGEIPIGLSGLTQNDVYGKSIDLCVLIDQNSCLNRREACAGVVEQTSEYVFNYMNYNKMTCKILADRGGLTRAAEIVGWKCEGVLKRNILFKGEWRDEKILATFQSDWRTR